MPKGKISLRRQMTDYFFTGLAAGLSVVVVSALIAILAYLVLRGAGSLNWSFLTQTPKPVGEAGGGMANALLAVTGLADGARKSSARFLLSAAVKCVEQYSWGWRVDTSRGPIRCRRVVIAAGSSSGEIAAMAGVELPLTHRVIQMVATEACEPFIDHLLYHAESRLTLKQVANGNVLIGGGWTASRDPVFGRPAVLSESLRASLAVARTIVPRLAEISMIRSWAGPNIYTPDGRPILGAVPGYPGLFAVVCNAYGFTLGPLCGLLVAELIAERPVSFDLSSFSLSRFATAESSLHSE